jgi:hypothetical protein
MISYWNDNRVPTSSTVHPFYSGLRDDDFGRGEALRHLTKRSASDTGALPAGAAFCGYCFPQSLRTPLR